VNVPRHTTGMSAPPPTLREARGKVISIPPAIYRALGEPHTIRWTLQNGEVNMEVAE